MPPLPIPPLVLGFVIFCVFLGAAYQFAGSAPDKPTPWLVRVIRQLVAIVLGTLLCLALLLMLHWATLTVGIAGIFIGVAIERLLNRFVRFMNDDSELIPFLGKLQQALSAFWGVMKATKPPEP